MSREDVKLGLYHQKPIQEWETPGSYRVSGRNRIEVDENGLEREMMAWNALGRELEV